MGQIYYRECNYDQELVDGDYQSSYFFSLIDGINVAIKSHLYIVSGIALLCGIEMAGREVLRFLKPAKSFNNTYCFDYFLKNYMGYSSLLRLYPKLYVIFRNGMVHGGFVEFDGEVSIGAGRTKKQSNLKGLHVTANGAYLTNDVLLCEFLDGIKQFREDELENEWHY